MTDKSNHDMKQNCGFDDFLEYLDIKGEYSNKTTLPELPLAPGDKDLLGMNAFRETVIEFIKHSDTPFSIALKGERGSGKTSLMHYIKDELCDKSNAPYYSVFVNVWQFDLSNQSSSSYTIMDILKSIIMQLGKHNPESKVFNITKKALMLLARGVAQAGAAKLGASNKIADDYFELFAKSEYNSDSKIKQLKDSVNVLVNEILFCKNNKRGFIFFIDDLDCVKPSLSIEILEFIRNVFDIRHCIFIFSIDDDTLNKGLEPRLGQRNFCNMYDYSRYLDKIFQVTIDMPVNYYDTNILLKKAVGVWLFDKDELSDDLFNELNIIVKQSVGENPRHIKLLINKLSLLTVLEQNIGKCCDYDCKTQMSVEEKKINFIMQCIIIAYPELYELMRIKPYFRGWTVEYANIIASGFSLQMDRDYLNNVIRVASAGLYDKDENPEEWELSLFRICMLTGRLINNFAKIVRLFRKLDELFVILLKSQNGDYEDLVRKLFSCVDKNTGVNSSFEELIKSRFGTLE